MFEHNCELIDYIPEQLQGLRVSLEQVASSDGTVYILARVKRAGLVVEVNREYVCVASECLYKRECSFGVARKSRAEQVRGV